MDKRGREADTRERIPSKQPNLDPLYLNNHQNKHAGISQQINLRTMKATVSFMIKMYVKS